MTTNHTPTPWHEGRYGVCADTTGYGRTHAQVALCENPADSAHIVRCVNAYDELVAALEEIDRIALSHPYAAMTCGDVANIARAALAKVQA
jgi:hypothetical protein